VINGIGHFWGYRNFESSDASRNIIPWGILIGGEELHNNHHSYAASARLSNKWWEFDIGWFYIRTLEIFKLAKVKKVSPKAIINTNKTSIDIETVRAVIRNRFHILKLYARKVTKPMLRQQIRSSEQAYRKLLRRASKLLTREDIVLDKTRRQHLDKALNENKTLQTVYQFKQQLKDIWIKTSSDQARRVQRLQKWCADAEKSGIQALQEFALYLRGYTLQLR
jgi:stearoyl-CoA desaturase (delta-9 desaturase)